MSAFKYAFLICCACLLCAQALTGCGPVCSGTTGSCLSLRVDGPALISFDLPSVRLRVWLGGADASGAPIAVAGMAEEKASLPTDLLIQPPPSMSRVDSVSVQLLGWKSEDDPLHSASLLLAGRTGISWSPGTRIEAAVNLSAPSIPYTHRVDLAAGGNPRSLVVLDADHNGQMDLAVRSDGGASGDSIFLLAANQDGSFLPAQYIFPKAAGRPLSDLTTADLDGDQNADLAFADVGTGAVYVLYGKGDGSFTLPVIFQLQANTPGALGAADLDADGHVDLVIAGKLGEVAISWNKGRGIFASRTVLTSGSTTASPLTLSLPAVVDLNLDGRLDVVVAGKLWLNEGGRKFLPPVAINSKAKPLAIAVQDFDGDTWSDLLATDASVSGQVTFLKGDGTGHMVAGHAQSLSSNPLLAVSADLNSDLIPDLALADQRTGLFALGNGMGGFQPADCPEAICQLPGKAVFARAQDLNGDEVPELLFVTEGGPGRAGMVSIIRDGTMAMKQSLIDDSSPNVLIDTFTLVGPRFGGLYEEINGAYTIEQSLDQAVWKSPFVASFNFVTPQIAQEPSRVQAAIGNIGAAGGMVQSASREVSVQFTDTTGNFVVQVDAIIPPSNFALSSLPYAGAPTTTHNSLTVTFRRDINYFAAPSIGVYDGEKDTDTGCLTGISDSHWHRFAVNFNKRTNRLLVYVDERAVCVLDLNSFAGGMYKNYSSAAVGMGGYIGMLYMDNFEAGPAR